MNQKEKGITLVMLIITTIILLILSGITITQLTKNGLLKNAELARKKTGDTKIEENKTLSEYEEMINAYIDGTRDTVTINKSEYENLVNKVKEIEENVKNNYSTKTDINNLEKEIALNRALDWTLIGNTSSKNWIKLTLTDNIEQYNYIAVTMHGKGLGDHCPAIISVNEFKKRYTSSSNTLNSGVQVNYVTAYYNNGIYCLCVGENTECYIYGIK